MNKLPFFFLFALTIPCFAQDDPSDVPAGNPVLFPTGNAQWTIDLTAKGSVSPTPTTSPAPKPTPSASGGIKKITVTQSDTLRRTVTSYLNGKTSESWFDVPLAVLVTTNTPDGSPVCLSGKNQLMLKSLATGFEPAAFEWLNKTYFVDFQMYKNQKCLHYKKDIQLSAYQRAYIGGVSGVYEVWVDKDKHLPIALSNGNTTGLYTFAKDPPSEPLSMPQPIADELKAYTTPPHIPGT